MKPNQLAESPAPSAIRAARLASGLTQTQAGAVLYSTCRAWQKWEGGEARMHPAMFELFLLKTHQISCPPLPAAQ